MNLFQYNSGCCAGYSSGGYLADSTVSGTITSGSQQQFYVRNTQAGTWTGGNWNMVFQGNTGGYPGTHCSNSAFWPITSIPQTPIIAEKPYSKHRWEGFPYRQLFYIPEIQKFYNPHDMTEAEEIQYNHRRRAIEKLVPRIQKYL